MYLTFILRKTIRKSYPVPLPFINNHPSRIFSSCLCALGILAVQLSFDLYFMSTLPQ